MYNKNLFIFIVNLVLENKIFRQKLNIINFIQLHPKLNIHQVLKQYLHKSLENF